MAGLEAKIFATEQGLLDYLHIDTGTKGSRMVAVVKRDGQQ